MGAKERLEGELEEFVYRADDGGWSVVRLKQSDGTLVTAVGSLGHISEGVHLVLDGYWSRHKRYGRRFKADSYLVENPQTLEGLVRYLAGDEVKGMGEELARRTVQRFGLETLRIMEKEPERLKEVQGIGPKRFEEIVGHWERDKAGRELAVMLRGHGLGAAVARRILERYGAEAMNVVTREPYRMAGEIPGVAFKTADAIARASGIPVDDPRRAEAAVDWLLREAEGQGHCFLPYGELVRRAAELELPPEAVAGAVHRPILQRTLVLRPAATPEMQPVYRSQVDRREDRVAKRVLERCADHFAVDGVGLAAEQRAGLELNPDQRRAVEAALSHRICVITGGPGTGKTTIVKVIMEAAGLAKEQWSLAAPTGRAARRMAESCGKDGHTLHRLLEYSMQSRSFTRNRTRPLELDGVLVDEASMLDLALMDALTEALPAKARLVLVGDADQLPSVGAGQVLRDLIDCGAVPVVSLHQVYRQAEGSGIIRNAHRILRGEVPISGEREPDARRDFFIVPRREPDGVTDALIRVLDERLPELGFAPLNDVQVLTPMRRGPLGTRALNELLQGVLNPEGEKMKAGNRPFRVGDRVIQVRNDYDNDIFNGDVGRVTGAGVSSLEVDFDGRRVALMGEQLDRLELAYAISIHKSQGSEYRAVVVLLHNTHYVMLRRSLLYTAVTRAKEFCCVVGNPWAVSRAVAAAGGGERWTGLASRIQGE
ncbi:MAG: ATP-dependent RecD-like DNA helicase [Alphaproteobacteria bacterium]|nr:ATP-dependent RecD-like DNA helicase [Alphaproteobacteria bacterium]